MAIVFEKWPHRIELYGWEETPSRLPVEADQQQVVTDVDFLDAAEAASYLRDFLGQEQEAVARLRALFASEHALSYGHSSDEEVLAQFAGLLVQNVYRIRQTSVYRAAWGKKPPAPLPSPTPTPPPKQVDPPKPVQNKAILSEFVEVVNRGVEGVVTGPGSASPNLPTHLNRQDKNLGLYKQYINIVDKDLEGQEKRHPEYGRYIEIKARVTVDGKPKAGESVVFSYTFKRGDYCPTLLGTDTEGFESAGGPSLHIATTGQDGWTPTIKFYLSAYAGDYFDLSAKGPDGKEVKLGHYQVWRKFWCQFTLLKGHQLPQLTTVKAAFDKVFAEVKQANIVELKEEDLPTGSVYPAWMVVPHEYANAGKSAGSEKILVVGPHNQQHLFSYLTQETDRPVKLHVIVGRHILHPNTDPVEAEKFVLKTNPSQVLSLNDEYAYLLKPTLTGESLVIQGKWEANGKSGSLTDENILIEQAGRKETSGYKIMLPAEAPDPAQHPVSITLQLRRAYQYEAAYCLGTHILIKEYIDRHSEYFNLVLTHEMGHSFGQVPSPGAQAEPLPDHPNQYNMGGTHCLTGAQKQYKNLSPKETSDDSSSFEYVKGTCVMFAGGYQDFKYQDFCTVCHPYIRLQNMEKPDNW